VIAIALGQMQTPVLLMMVLVALVVAVDHQTLTHHPLWLITAPKLMI
jgi:hypothetical protein